MPENLEIRNIRTDGGTQPRAGINQQVVADYAQDIKDNALFPPVVVYYDGSNYWLADGFHRLAAHKFAQKQRILADVRQGTLRDAILYSVGANATHGLQRSREDKRRAVATLLTDPDWGQWSDRLISKQCNVSHTYVANIREELGLTGNVASDNGNGNGRKYITKHGTEATMSVDNGGNVASEEITAVLRAYLEKEYSTTEPAVLAVMARALSAKREHCTAIESRLRLYQAGSHGVQVALIALAQELQSYVPQPNGTAVPNMPAMLELIEAIKSLSPEAAERVCQWCDGISVRNDAKDHAPVWDAMERLICALRRN